MPTRHVVVLLGCIGAIAVVSGLLRVMPGVSHATVSLALLLVVLGAATVLRLRLAIAVAVVAMLALNYFFLPPVGTFTIADPENWVVMVSFLGVAIVGSTLSAAAQDRARDASARRDEVTRLFELTRDVLLTSETAGAIEALAGHVGRRFGLSRLAICLPGTDGWLIHQGGAEALSVSGAVLDVAFARARREAPADVSLPATHDSDHGAMNLHVSLVPLRHGRRPVGLMAVASPALDATALEAIAGVVAIAIERTQFLQERDMAERLRQNADLAATLLASLSHDLRTPLTVIRVAVENLRDDLQPDDRRAQATAALVELDRLTRLFQDILDMARIDAAAVRVDHQWVAATDVVDAALAYAGPVLRRHALRVDAEAEMEVEIDPRLASVALSHVLENAAAYSAVECEILVLARVGQDGLRISVTDHGPGLDPTELDQLFERFYRGHSARQACFGTGMGLSITRGLLAAAGGHVWGENVPGGGARFTLVVPGPVRAAAVLQ